MRGVVLATESRDYQGHKGSNVEAKNKERKGDESQYGLTSRGKEEQVGE